MSKSPPKTQAKVRKHLSSSILLWMRTDQPRQTGMDHWKGPHSKIISATPGLEEYRQIHLAEVNPGLWPATPGVETDIPVERKIDGVAEVTFHSPLWAPAVVAAPLRQSGGYAAMRELLAACAPTA